MSWNLVKGELRHLDRAGLVGLLKDLHALAPENRTFLAARFGLGPDPLASYKTSISRWICPDVARGQDISVKKAKKAMSDYRKAIGQPEGVAELCIHYCEEAARLISECSMEDEAYFSALVRMYEQALSKVIDLPPSEREPMIKRLNVVREALDGTGWGVDDAIRDIWYEYVG
jgi:hypothetical protein